MPDQYSKLVGYASKYPYLVGISTDSGNFGTGILISPRFVLTCGHVLQDSAWVEVISREVCTSARVQKVDDSLDLALLELTRPISAPKAKFTDSPLQPGLVLQAVGVQATPGQPDALSVAEIRLKYRNKNDAGGKILDIQLEGGARSGYSGGPVVVEKGGSLHCVGVMRSGGPWATSTNAVGFGAIQAFVEDYIPDMSGSKSDALQERLRRLLIFTTLLFGAGAVGVITGWHYLASHSPKGGAVIATAHEPEKTASGQPTPGEKPPPSLPQDPLQTQGNPDVMVWVNTASNVYHCPRTRSYGKKTKHGEYMTQAEAQKKANRPALGKVCK
jgi:hypothetical protein